MDKASRSELIETINSQKDQLQQYKSKLRDVVAAYKSVVKEKEALEASFSVLSVSGSASSVNTGDSKSSDTATGDEKVDGKQPDPLGVEEVRDETSALREQIKTLSSSLTTLSQEKKSIEANFIAERKRLRGDIEQLQGQLLDEKKRICKQAEGFELQLSDLKSRIRTQQLEREQEQTDHALMLRELQTLLSKERSSKETLEVQLEEAQQAVKESKEKPQDAPVVSEVYEHQIKQLQNELKTVRDRLKSAENKANQPSPFVIQLQKDMEAMKTDYQRQVEKEQEKAAEAESQLKSQSRQAEERVSSLESKVSELSQEVGHYEKLRFQDQQAISKLRERVTQLDMENTALTRAASLTPENPVREEENMEAEEILDKIMLLRSQLKTVAGKSEKTINLSSIFVEDMNKADEESPLCKQYKEELEQVKEEFERYKLRAQSVLKNKNKDGGTTSKETELLKEQVSDLRDRLRMANFHHQEEIAQFQTKVDNLSKALLAQEEKFKLDTAQLKHSHQKEIGELEVEFKKQRERTVAMLAEKDSEIQRLKAMTGQSLDVDALRQFNYNYNKSSESDQPGDRQGSDEEQEAVNKLLDLPKGIKNEAAFLHFAQEKGRLNVELNSLRKQKRQLEMSLKDLQVSASQKQEKLRDEINALTEQLAETDRHYSREGANVEYLKNVMVKFLTSTDAHGKKTMLKALTTILQFSPHERDMVKQAQGKGWWPA